MKNLQQRIAQLLETIPEEYRTWVKDALDTAISQSEFAEFYISIAIFSDDFRISIDTTNENAGALASYDYRTNVIAIYTEVVHKRNKFWTLRDPLQLARMLLHEFWHAYLTILHAPNQRPQDYRETISILFAIPIYSPDRRVYDSLQQALIEDFVSLAKALNFFLAEPNLFSAQYPELHTLFLKLSEKYIPKLQKRSMPLEQGETCEEKFQDTLLALANNEEATIVTNNSPWVVKKYLGPNDENACVFLDHEGNSEWALTINRLYELYWYIKDNLLNSNKFNSYADHYRRFGSDSHAMELAYGELTAMTVEIGPFIVMLRKTLEKLNSDYTSHIPPTHTPQVFKQVTALPNKVEREYRKLVLKLKTYTEIDERVLIGRINQGQASDLAENSQQRGDTLSSNVIVPSTMAVDRNEISLVESKAKTYSQSDNSSTLVSYPYNNTMDSIELTLVREIARHEKTGSPLFIFHAFNPQKEEVGNFTLYAHPILCRSEDGLRNNLIDATGVFEDRPVDTKNLPDICEELPPDESLLDYSTIAFSMAHGAVRGSRPFIERAMQHNGVDQRTSKLTANVFYYFCYGMFSFMRQYQNNDNLALEEEQVIYKSMVSSFYSMFYLLALTLFSSGIKIVAEQAEKSNYTKTSKGLLFFDKCVMPPLFYFDTVRNAGWVTATIGVAGGLFSQKTVEAIGECILPRPSEKVPGKKQ